MRKSVAGASAALLVLTVGVGCLALPGLSQDRGGFPGSFTGAPIGESAGFFGGAGEGFSGQYCSMKAQEKDKPREPFGKNGRFPYMPETGLPIPAMKIWKGNLKADQNISALKTNVKLEGTVLDEKGEPAKGMEIHLLGLDSAQDFWGCTDSKGRYSVGALAGNYVACILYKGHIGLCRDFALRKGQKAQSDLHLAFFTRTEPEVLLKRLPTRGPGGLFAGVQGIVFDEKGQRVPGIEVEVRLQTRDSSQPFAATTNSQGRYSITTPPGEYLSCVRYKGKTGLCRDMTLRQGRIVESDFDLQQFK